MGLQRFFRDKREFSRIAAVISFILLVGNISLWVDGIGHENLVIGGRSFDPALLSVVAFGAIALALAMLILASFTDRVQNLKFGLAITQSLAVAGITLLFAGSLVVFWMILFT